MSELFNDDFQGTIYQKNHDQHMLRANKDLFPIVKTHRMLTTEDPFITILTAKPRSGKSFFMKYILRQLLVNDHVSHGWVFCQTKFNGAYDFLPKRSLAGSFDIEEFKNILAFQNVDPKKRPGFIIFDDIVAGVPWNNPVVSSFFMNYRHYNLRVLIATQYPNKIPPTIRETATFFVMFNSLTERSLDAIGSIAFADKRRSEIPNMMKKNLAGHKYYCIIADMEESEYSRFKSPGVNGLDVKKWWTGYILPTAEKDRKKYLSPGVVTVSA